MNQSAQALHRTVWDLIPWVVNGRASAHERGLVDQHEGECEDCHDELEFHRRLHFAMALESGKARDPVAGLRQLRHRIAHAAADDSSIEKNFDRPALQSPRRSLAMKALVAALILETAGLVVLSSALLGPGDLRSRTSPYRTLATAPLSSSRIVTLRVVWVPTTTLEQMEALLRRLDLEVVSGPTEAGVYSLSPSTRTYDLDRQLAQLRADRNVRFAEPIAPSATGP